MTTGAFAAAVLEYLTREVLELAAEACQEHHKKTIVPRHLKLALGNDEELNKLVCSTFISEGGVIPQVHEELFGKKGKKASNTQEM